VATKLARDLRFGQACCCEPPDLGGIETRWTAAITTLGLTSLDAFPLALANAVPLDLGEDAGAVAIVGSLVLSPTAFAQSAPSTKAECVKAKMKWDAKGGADKKGACSDLGHVPLALH
jgi:hypothetical protein